MKNLKDVLAPCVVRNRGLWWVGRLILVAMAGLLLSACGPSNVAPEPTPAAEGGEFMVVDCLLPGQLRQLGQKARFLTARRAVKTTEADCAIRGGEYTSFDRADYATALKVWLEQAKSGDAEAQTYVGEIYEKGLGLTPDYAVAAIWYRRAAEQDFTRAQINLGNLYEKGLGVTNNPIEALNWYRRASGLNSDHLQYASTIVANNVLQRELNTLASEVSTLRDFKQTTEAEQAAAEEQRRLLAERREQQRLQEAQQQAAIDSGRDLVITVDTATNTPPNILILDPPISLTRSGPTALLRSANATKEIIGKVESPYDVQSFTVNGEIVELDEFNLFFVDVPLQGQKTDVALQAVDSKAQEVAFQFAMFLDRTQQASPSQSISFDSDTQAPSFAGINFGRYYALVIGNRNYQYYNDLETPESDAREIAGVLQKRYGFSTQLLINANRYEILSALNDLREKLTENDNLLIYYAGHGELDDANERGYWLPVDAEPGNTSNWLSNVSISDQLNTFNAKHVMVVADSCYAGTLSTASVARQAATVDQELQKEWLQIMNTVRARTVMTSGGVRPVLDSGGGSHSVFAKSFIDTLNNNDTLLDGNRLFISVLSEVRERSKALGVEQIPDYGAIKYAGHEAGEFFLVPATQG